MRVDLQPAYVLHTRPYRDTSLMLEVITPEHGRMTLVARGARRKRRGGTQGAELQPFIPLLLSFAGRGEMKNLVASEMAGSALPVRGERLFSGMYVNELLVRLLHRHDPHPQLFANYGETLASLATDPLLEDALRRFEFGLLDELGYGFQLDVDGYSGAAVRVDAYYNFQAEYGLVEEHPLGGKPLTGFPGEHLLAMAGGDLKGDSGRTAKRLLRQALASHLGPEPLHSRELFRTGRDRSGRERSGRDRSGRERSGLAAGRPQEPPTDSDRGDTL